MSRKPTIATATEAEIRDAFSKRERLLKPKSCLMCSTTFKPVRMWQRFCDDGCRALWHRLKRSVENAKWDEAEPKDEDVK